MENMILIGFMGSGKTTVGRELSKMLKMDFVDMDAEIEKRENKSIKEIFDSDGEEYFRKIERELFTSYEGRYGLILAAGGGIVESVEAEAIRKFDKVVFLHATKEELLRRTKDSQRPLLMVDDVDKVFDELMDKRQSLYENASDLIIQTTDKKIKNICKEIVEMI